MVVRLVTDHNLKSTHLYLIYTLSSADDSSDDECSTKRVKHAHANDDDDDEGRTLRPMQPQPKKGMVDLSKGIGTVGMSTA